MTKEFDLDAMALQLAVTEKINVFHELATEEVPPEIQESFDELLKLLMNPGNIKLRLVVFPRERLQELYGRIRKLYKQISGEEENYGHTSFHETIDRLSQSDIEKSLTESGQQILNYSMKGLEDLQNDIMSMDICSLYAGDLTMPGNRFSLAAIKTYTEMGNIYTVTASLAKVDDTAANSLTLPCANFQVSFPETAEVEDINPLSITYTDESYSALLGEIIDALISDVDLQQLFRDSGNELLPYQNPNMEYDTRGLENK